uniref:Uncharacterized protein n=1 Tax=Dromaius novaehollandiae TaxID=8790 RepID=A0A8C4J2K6_DRONO
MGDPAAEEKAAAECSQMTDKKEGKKVAREVKLLLSDYQPHCPSVQSCPPASQPPACPDAWGYSSPGAELCISLC